MNELRKTVKNSESLRLQAEQKMKQLEQENSELKKPLEKKELQPPDRA
jgi:hypothetical protein